MNLPLSLIQFLQLQNRFQAVIGQGFAWLSLTLVLSSALVVILRYGFDSGSIALQESLMYQHAILFMMGMAYTLYAGKHVRVDVFYTRFSPRKRAWVDLIGALGLALPSMVFILWSSWGYVATSWHILEGSPDAGGLPFLYLLKSFILIMASLMSLQLIAIAVESYLQLFHAQVNHVKTYLMQRPMSEEGKL